MHFDKVISTVIHAFEKQGIRYALIGGFALAMRGVHRSTLDLDLILALEDLDTVDAILSNLGYIRVFESPNVSHYQSKDPDFGRIDILHAFRRPSLKMLERAERLSFQQGSSLYVAAAEDLIALKIQALCNDPERAVGDWSDIRLLLRAAADQNVPMDWALLAEYLEIFQLSEQLERLQSWYGKTE